MDDIIIRNMHQKEEEEEFEENKINQVFDNLEGNTISKMLTELSDVIKKFMILFSLKFLFFKFFYFA